MSFLEATEQTAGTVESLCEMVSNDELISIYPGGLREGMLADSFNYEVMWPTSAGFAKVANRAKCVGLPFISYSLSLCISHM